MELVGLKEEDDNNYLNCKRIMSDAIYFKYGLPLVKSDKRERNKEIITVFNSKTLFCVSMRFLPLDY